MTAPAAPTRPLRIAVTMTCFNRREITLRCLRNLMLQQSDAVTLTITLVDDASPDGTAAAIRTHFPQVQLLAGTGDLFWGGGMHLAMTEAIKQPFDFMLWLNDDVTLQPDALATLLLAQRRAQTEGHPTSSIIVGAVTAPETGRISYAGLDRRNRYHPAQLDPVVPRPRQLTACDSMNGNCVLIPASLIDAIGLIDHHLPHRYGDIDYGYRARRAGAHILIAPDPVGTCSPNPQAPPNLAEHTQRQRWTILTAPLGIPLKPMFRFMWRHGGAVGAALASWTTAKLALKALRP